MKRKKNTMSCKLIYPGHLSYHHGIDIAIRAFGIIKETLPDARFDIFARSCVSEYKYLIENLIRDLGLKDSIQIHSALPPEKVPDIFYDATFGVVPKRGSGFAAEAFSSKIFDFFAAGIPIIASKTKIDEYYFDDTIICFFEDENYKDMAQKTIELYNNTKMQKSLVNNGYTFIKTNNWEQKSQEYKHILSEHLNKK